MLSTNPGTILINLVHQWCFYDKIKEMYNSLCHLSSSSTKYKEKY